MCQSRFVRFITVAVVGLTVLLATVNAEAATAGFCGESGQSCIDNCNAFYTDKQRQCYDRFWERLDNCENRPNPEVCENRVRDNLDDCLDSVDRNWRDCLQVCRGS